METRWGRGVALEFPLDILSPGKEGECGVASLGDFVNAECQACSPATGRQRLNKANFVHRCSSAKELADLGSLVQLCRWHRSRGV